ncbi:dCTP deaminase [Saccharothrix lopnurensis]|uniref:2'-deoxycytidine 5'-triphosphate deaminase domain-containing protein n=1 Tax=Saccharothrix lopnurensis TaxID=1670621 RepID=A0ABW1PAH2_9PSEU
MILSGSAIQRAVAAGEICVDPFDPALTNPNSHNYRLGPRLRVMADDVADPTRSPALTEFTVSEVDGHVLEPGRVYLGTTAERIGSTHYVPSLIGRSSLGRLGVFLQVSADLGQLGAVHHWTLEIVVTQPVRVYAGMVVGQVSFWRPVGGRMPYEGHYGTRSDPAPWNPAVASGFPEHGERKKR